MPGRNAASRTAAKWRETGSKYLKKRVKRVFGRRVAGAMVLKWVPKEDNGGLALWHVQHDDGDEVREGCHGLSSGDCNCYWCGGGGGYFLFLSPLFMVVLLVFFSSCFLIISPLSVFCYLSP